MKKLYKILSVFALTAMSIGANAQVFTESFDGGATPAGWTATAASGPGWIYSTGAGYDVTATLDHTGNGGNYAWIDFSGTDAGVILESPVIDVSSLTTPELGFFFESHYTGALTPFNLMFLEYWDGAAWSVAATLQGNTPFGWDEYTYDMSAFTFNGGNDLQIRFRGESGGATNDFNNDLLLDDIAVYEQPTCPKPSNLAASFITSNSVQLDWTEVGGASQWIVEVGAPGFTPSATTTTINNPETVSGLMPITDYQCYVRSFCSAGDTSFWTGPISFTTECATFVAPFLEQFDATLTPPCWTESGNNVWEYFTPGGGASTATDHSANGGNAPYMDGSDNGDGEVSSLISPLVDISGLTNAQLRYYVFYNNTNDAARNKLIVELFDGSAWIQIDSIQENLGNDWVEMNTFIGLSGMPITGDVQVRFTVTGDQSMGGFTFNNDIVIDDVEFFDGASCPLPSNLVASYPDNDSAVVNWIPGFNETMWNLEVGVAGFAPGTGAEIFTSSQTDDFDTITGLSQLTDYDVYVQADCGMDSSAWVGPISFTTLPNCPDVSGVVLTGLQEDSLAISWTSNGSETMWDIEYGVAGYTPGTGTLVSTTVTNDTIVGLMSGTEYDFYVRSDCGGLDQGIWIGAFSYTTPCYDLAPATLPFLEDFESFSGVSLGDDLLYCGTDKIWDFTTSNQTQGRVQYGTSAYLPLSGNGSLTLDMDPSGATTVNSADLTLDLSAYSSGTTGLGLSFLIAEYGDETHTNDKIWVRGSNTDPWLVVLDWQNVTNFTTTVLVENINLTLILANGGQVPSSTFQLRFGQEDNFPVPTDGVNFDNILIEEVPCFAPVAAAQVSTVADTIIVGWTVNGTETEWNVEYGPVGFTPGTGTFYTTTNNPDTITGLALGSTFDFYVQAACSATDSSAWFGPTVIATTLTNDFSCDAIFVPSDGSTNFFSNIGATQQAGESFNGNGHSAWFKTVVPASGHLAIGTCGNDANTQLSTYAYHVNCTDSLWMNNIDNTTFNPWGCDLNSPAGIETCAQVAGDTIYFSITTFGADGVFPVTAWDLQYEAGTGSPITVCVGDVVDLNAQITGAMFQFTGEFDYFTNPTVIVDDTTAATANLTFGNDTVVFIVENSCMADTAYIVIDPVGAPNSGVAVDPFTVCNTGDAFLMDGLTGTFDGGGVWTDDDATGLLVGNIYVANGQPLGAYNFTYTVDNGICPAESTQITAIVDNCVGVEESIATFGVYPNPNNGTFSISSNVTEVATIQVIDAQGKVVYNSQINLAAGIASEVQVADVSTGIYMVRLVTEGSVSVQNIMVK